MDTPFLQRYLHFLIFSMRTRPLVRTYLKKHVHIGVSIRPGGDNLTIAGERASRRGGGEFVPFFRGMAAHSDGSSGSR